MDGRTDERSQNYIPPTSSGDNKVWYFMRIVCQQTILMKYHALFVIFKNPAKFEIVVKADDFLGQKNTLTG